MPRRKRFRHEYMGLCKGCGSFGHVTPNDQQGSDPLGDLCRECFRGAG